MGGGTSSRNSKKSVSLLVRTPTQWYLHSVQSVAVPLSTQNNESLTLIFVVISSYILLSFKEDTFGGFPLPALTGCRTVSFTRLENSDHRGSNFSNTLLSRQYKKKEKRKTKKTNQSINQ